MNNSCKIFGINMTKVQTYFGYTKIHPKYRTKQDLGIISDLG